MSCLDVMYHQSYGAHHYLPATSAAAAAAYKAAYYHHQQQQQKKFSAYSKMQESMELPSPCAQGKQPQKPSAEQEIQREEEQGGGGGGVRGKEVQPAEAEYLSSRCVLFTYFHGEIGDVVDEHFSRALSQPSAFTGETKNTRLISGGLWKDGGAHSEGQCGSLPSSLWSSSYPSQTSPCLSTVHPDFPPNAAFHPADTGIWSGHGLPQPGLAPPAALPDSWHYSLGAQGGASYPHVHEVYPHMHPRHAHAHHMLHHAHAPALDPRFSPLLLPSVRPSCSPAPHTEGVKTELDPSTTPAPSWPASFHGPVDIFDSALEQDKAKATVWF